MLWLLVGVAAIFWFVMFWPYFGWRPNFWLLMSFAASTLSVSGVSLSLRKYRDVFSFRPVHIVIGVVSAVILYGVFYVGHDVAAWIMEFAPRQVQGIYTTRTEAEPWVIALLLVFLIGPAEELFWRGFVQRELMDKMSPVAAWLVCAGIYALVHIWALNFMLFGASLVCGLFWGAMFMRYRSVWPGLISHALWDVAVFVLWPIG